VSSDPPTACSDVTRVLNTGDQSDVLAASELLTLVYEELRRVAAVRMAHEAPGQTLQPTALVHEAWLRLAGGKPRHWNDRTHFFATASEAMRRILVDNARRKRAARHGGGQRRVEMPEVGSEGGEPDDRLLAVDEALEKFAALDPKKADLVKLRYFIGMTVAEAARALDISEQTAKRHWAFARAWLHEEIKARHN